MYPVLWETAYFSIYSYGLMLSLAVLAGTVLAMRRVKAINISSDLLIEVVIFISLAGLVGARLLFVFINWSLYKENLTRIFALQAGGLSFYGALILGAIALMLWCRWRKVSFLQMADFLSPYVLLGYAFARVGCFLNGCCYGKATDLPWGYPAGFDNMLRHPAQIYSSLGALVLFFLVLFLQKRYHAYYKNNLLLVIAFYGLLRFTAEFFREERAIWLGFSLAQLFSGPLGLIAVTLIILRFINYSRCREQDEKTCCEMTN